jgi:carbon-monoxide dehydrogenase large subunit
VIATGRVRYVGEPVAVVLANDLATANDALELIGLDLEEMPVVTDCKAAASGDVLLFDGTTGNSPIVFSAEMGNADKAFVEADYRRRERFSVQRHTACPMETRGLVADWDPARRRLIVHGAAKVPFYNRQILARMLAMEETEIDLMELDVGGGFGARGEFYPEDFLIPYAARRLQRPVRWVESRDEHFLATNHAREAYADVEIACMRDGRVVGLRGRFEVDNGAYVRTNGFTGPCNVALFMSGPYFVPNIALDAAVFMTNKPTVFSQVGRNDWRAADFVVESMC